MRNSWYSEVRLKKTCLRLAQTCLCMFVHVCACLSSVVACFLECSFHTVRSSHFVWDEGRTEKKPRSTIYDDCVSTVGMYESIFWTKWALSIQMERMSHIRIEWILYNYKMSRLWLGYKFFVNSKNKMK